MKRYFFSIMFVALAMISFTASATTLGMSAFEPASYTQTLYPTDISAHAGKEVVVATRTELFGASSNLTHKETMTDKTPGLVDLAEKSVIRSLGSSDPGIIRG